MTKPDAAKAMRNLLPRERDEAIAASVDVLDGRARFAERRKQAELARAYRKPQKPPPGGTA